MDSNNKLTKALAAMERMEKLMEALNNDLETVKDENCYLKAVVETNNDPTHPDHPLYEPPARSHFSPPADNSPLPPVGNGDDDDRWATLVYSSETDI